MTVSQTQPWGADTEPAMALGARGAAVGLVHTLVDRFALAYGAYPRVIATGGDALALFENDEIVEHIVPDLQLAGLAHAYEVMIESLDDDADDDDDDEEDDERSIDMHLRRRRAGRPQAVHRQPERRARQPQPASHDAPRPLRCPTTRFDEPGGLPSSETRARCMAAVVQKTGLRSALHLQSMSCGVCGQTSDRHRSAHGEDGGLGQLLPFLAIPSVGSEHAPIHHHLQKHAKHGIECEESNDREWNRMR